MRIGGEPQMPKPFSVSRELSTAGPSLAERKTQVAVTEKFSGGVLRATAKHERMVTVRKMESEAPLSDLASAIADFASRVWE